MIALLVSGVAWSEEPPAECEPKTALQLQVSARRVQDLLIEDNGAVLRARQAEEALFAAIPCAQELLPPAAAAEILLAHGLTTFFMGDMDTAGPWLLSARAAAPELSLNPELAPHEAHPLAVQWQQAPEGAEPVPLPPLTEGMWFVNGRPTTVAPADGPYVAQHVAGDGSIETTQLVRAGLPAATVAPEESETPVAVPEPAPVPMPPPAGPDALIAVERVEPVRRTFPVRTVVGSAALLGGAALASTVALQRTSLCDLPDSNGDGFYDCPVGTQLAFWGGVGGATAGAVVGLLGLSSEWKGTTVAVGPMGSGGWGGQVGWSTQSAGAKRRRLGRVGR